MSTVKPRRPLVRKAFAALAALALAPAAQADVVSAASDAYLASADLSLTFLGSQIAGVSLPPQVLAEGTAPAPYGDSNGLASFSQTFGSFAYPTGFPILTGSALKLQTGIVSTTADSNVVGTGPGSTDATSQLASLSLGVLNYSVPFVGSGSLVSVTASAITTTAGVTGDYGALVGAGSLSVIDLVVSVAGVDYTYNGTIAPNTIVDLGAGITLTLNEQVLGGDGINDASMLTNFLRLSFDDAGVSLGGYGLLLNGDVVLGHSFAAQTAAVPEPSSVALAGLGVAGLAAARRARRKPAA